MLRSCKRLDNSHESLLSAPSHERLDFFLTDIKLIAKVNHKRRCEVQAVWAADVRGDESESIEGKYRTGDAALDTCHGCTFWLSGCSSFCSDIGIVAASPAVSGHLHQEVTPAQCQCL